VNILFDQKGMAIVSVIMVVLIFAALGAAVLHMVANDARIAQDEVAFTRALYAAEGGIRKFIVELNDNPNVESWPDEIWEGFENYPVGESKIESISVEDLGSYFEVTVTGTSGRARKTLVARISKPQQSSLVNLLDGLTVCGTGSELNIQGNASIVGNIYAAGGISFNGNIDITGNVYADGDVSLTGSIEVEGDVYASGTVSVKGNSRIDGEIYEGSEVYIQPFPELDLDWYRQAAIDYGHYYDSTKIFSQEELQDMSGVYFVEGDVEFSNFVDTYTGQAVIAAAGNISVNNADLVPGDENSSLGLISMQNVEMSGNSNFNGIIISQGNLDVSGSGSIEGAFLANNIGNFKRDFYYNPEYADLLAGYLGPGGEGATVLQWREQYPVY